VTIYTIGYEGLSLEQFLELLAANGIEHLVDIREAPTSRKAGFAKAALSAAVAGAGIRYSHLRPLGCPKPIRDRYKESGDWDRYTRDFKIYLGGQRGPLEDLRSATAEARTCLLCYEADFHRCHRWFVAEAVARGAERIQHVLVKPLSVQAELRFE
jgi:uncharacterized protein (DUF488 family)